MAELKFETGVQEYTVHGVKGDVVIRFNPVPATRRRAKPTLTIMPAVQ